jgi:hypothetical protein
MANFEMFPPIITPYGVFSGGPFGLKVYEAQKKIIEEITKYFILPAHLCGEKSLDNLKTLNEGGEAAGE